jgi:KDO2-lipid IV(A) lauroyltransferase
MTNVQMRESLHRVRRAATEMAIRQAIVVSGLLPDSVQRSAVRSLVALSGGIPMLHSRVRQNMRLALGRDVPAQAVHDYFRHAGWFYASALSTFHHGFAASPVPDQFVFDESVRLLDDAVAEGRGVVFIAPHWSGHELLAAMIARRHPMTMLVRQAPTPERTARKLKWYNALGAEIVLRPRHSSTIKDAVAYLQVLKKGKLLAITPDLLADPGQGVETRLFGRPAPLHGGAFALSIAARAPMIRGSIRWQSGSTVRVMFDRAPPPADSGNREAAVRAAAQEWCRWFEAKLQADPENWLFWLDKRWTHFLRTTPRRADAE